MKFVEFVAASLATNFTNFTKKITARLYVIGLKYNFSQCFGPRCLTPPYILARFSWWTQSSQIGQLYIMAGTAMPRNHRGTGVSPVTDWAI